MIDENTKMGTLKTMTQKRENSSSRGAKGVSIIFFNYRKMAQTMAFCAYYVTINLEMSQILPFVWVPVAANGAKNGTWP